VVARYVQVNLLCQINSRLQIPPAPILKEGIGSEYIASPSAKEVTEGDFINRQKRGNVPTGESDKVEVN